MASSIGSTIPNGSVFQGKKAKEEAALI